MPGDTSAQLTMAMASSRWMQGGVVNCQEEETLSDSPLSSSGSVSCPVFTLRVPGAQTVVGDVVELHCEAQRGSPLIFPPGEGESFNLSLTREHSGNSCEDDKGLGVQRSEEVLPNVISGLLEPGLGDLLPENRLQGCQSIRWSIWL
ncbi:hypothetical protein HPG69_006396, partial [Diceros bicornis minor]